MHTATLAPFLQVHHQVWPPAERGGHACAGPCAARSRGRGAAAHHYQGAAGGALPVIGGCEGSVLHWMTVRSLGWLHRVHQCSRAASPAGPDARLATGGSRRARGGELGHCSAGGGREASGFSCWAGHGDHHLHRCLVKACLLLPARPCCLHTSHPRLPNPAAGHRLHAEPGARNRLAAWLPGRPGPRHHARAALGAQKGDQQAAGGDAGGDGLLLRCAASGPCGAAVPSGCCRRLPMS